MRVDEESGNDIKDILSHSIMIQREWSRKEPISLPLCQQKERDDGSEKNRTVERAINKIISAGSNAGKGVAPWECDPRLIRAGGRSRGLQSKARQGVDRTGSGGSWIFANLQKSTTSRTSHGRHPFPQSAGRQKYERHPFPRKATSQNPPCLGSGCILEGRILGYHRIGVLQNICA